VNSGRKKITIFTDGSCLGNPGPGGYAAILDYKANRKELSGGFRRTTNNRMELLAAVEGLAALREDCDVTLYSDSEYVVRAMNQGWPYSWRKNGWRRYKNKVAVNSDLWQRLLDLCDSHTVQFQWIRGHSGHPENERCDRLAVAAAQLPNLPADVGYESSLSSSTPLPKDGHGPCAWE